MLPLKGTDCFLLPGAGKGGDPLRLCYLRYAYGLGEHYNSVAPGIVVAGESEEEEEEEEGSASDGV